MPLSTGTFNQALGPLTLKALGHVVIIPTSWPHEWCPSLGPTHSKTLAVETVEYGDGYRYRITRGLNPVGSTLTYAFPFEDVEHLTDMDVPARHGSRGFLFPARFEPAPIYVCCNLASHVGDRQQRVSSVVIDRAAVRTDAGGPLWRAQLNVDGVITLFNSTARLGGWSFHQRDRLRPPTTGRATTPPGR